ncbi:MAG TPA: sulfatase-like hydrolase/transferase [Bryobacteraceae bacterium]
MKRLTLALGRVCVILFFLLSSLYALLAYIPFTYEQVHKANLLPPLTAFGRMQHRLWWPAAALVCATIAPEFRRGKNRVLAIGLAATLLAAGIVLQFRPIMIGLHNDVRSYWYGMVCLVPLLWIAAIDLVGHWRRIEWAEFCREDDRRIFRVARRTAVFVAVAYSCIFYARTSVAWGVGERLSALLATTLCHLLIFGVLFAAVVFVRSIASLTPWPSAVEFALSNAMTGAIGWMIVRNLVFRPISFEGRLADGYAAALAAALIGSLAGLAVRFWREGRGPVGGLELALRPVTLPVFSNRFLQPLMLAALGALAWQIALNTAIMDWNYMFQKLSASMVWVMSFALLYKLTPTPRGMPDKRFTLLFVAAMVMSGYRLTASAMAERPKSAAALEKYAGYDASFRLIRDAISAPPKDDSFYKFLTQNTNIPRSTPTSPVDVNMAGPLAATSGPKPNIFFIVIDSLRRDYLSPYNSANHFTPAIDAFARESVVFRNSFTRYGGTGLAEPSIWVGGMTLHQQYVTPFYPMNALEKLIEAEQYQPYISMDSILRTVVKPTPNLVELDSTTSGMDYRLCSSLQDLESKLSQRAPGGPPIFSYSQPQDIHISVINREKSSVVDGGSYSGFYPPYASRVHRLDGCFGTFIDFLKARGLYDDSFVILTADHGDSLGEEGRWGHAYALVPEVVRIPLIVHVPKQYQSMYYDPKAVAFQSDVTPSLYYVLGHKPTLKMDFYGRPLFTADSSEQNAWRKDTYLIAASYAAVYATLADAGKSLYVFDAVNYKDTYFEIADGPSSGGMMSSTKRTEYADLIRKRIEEISKFYKFTPK